MRKPKPHKGYEAEYAAEQCVLGALLILSVSDHSKESVDGLINDIEERYFYHRQHKLIFQTIRFLVNKGRPVDMLTVNDVLDHHGQIDLIGGFAYIADLCKCVPSVLNVRAYIDILKEAADRRSMNIVLQNHLDESTDSVMTDLGDTLSELEGIRNRLLDRHVGLRHFSELVDDWLELYEARFEGDGEPPFKTGIDNVDAIIAPVHIPSGSLVVVGARPKMGKTQFILKISQYIGVDLNKGLASFTLEMTHEQLIERMLGMRACVSYDLFYQTKEEVAELEPDEQAQFYERFRRVRDAKNEYSNSNYYISDDPNSSIETIESECRQLHKQLPLGGIMVDYLTLMPKVAAERNDLAYAEITRRLKQLAKELGCVVFLVTQLNRSLEMRQDKRPLPSDSRDTGQIEQDCDLWIGLYRDAFYNVNSEYPPDVIEVLIRLNRHGGTGTALCRMDKGNITPYKGAPIQPRPFSKHYKDTSKQNQRDPDDNVYPFPD